MKFNELKPDKVHDYLISGNAIFTVQNEKTKRRFTYKISRGKTAAFSHVYYVRVLAMNDNNSASSYRFVGAYTVENGFVFSKKRAKVSGDSLSVLTIIWVFKNIHTLYLYPFVKFWHESYCGKCGKKLTTPESLKYGYGRECMKILLKKGSIIISDKDEDVEPIKTVQLSLF
jgi:hypothetical protein